MSDEKERVLGRMGARQLTADEVRVVCGASGTGTETLCSFNPITRKIDGDLHECVA
ncbi:MAG TPA: hypothetical protein VI685_17695 [Candidatus Angelobacter sp.]